MQKDFFVETFSSFSVFVKFDFFNAINWSLCIKLPSVFFVVQHISSYSLFWRMMKQKKRRGIIIGKGKLVETTMQFQPKYITQCYSSITWIWNEEYLIRIMWNLPTTKYIIMFSSIRRVYEFWYNKRSLDKTSLTASFIAVRESISKKEKFIKLKLFSMSYFIISRDILLDYKPKIIIVFMANQIKFIVTPVSNIW